LPSLHATTRPHADRRSPIGVFDSGIGGLSVLKHLRAQLPKESFLYIADSAFAPYGERSVDELIDRSIRITEHLLLCHIKALVIACNTATAAAVKVLRLRYPDLIIIGMEPGLKPAAQQSRTKIVGVLATRSTLQSEKFKLLHEQLSHETQVRFIPQACVGLVNEIEKGDLNAPAILALLRLYIPPLLEQGADTLVLGCTHYPFVTTLIERVIQENLIDRTQTIKLIDTGEAVARRLQSLLASQNFQNDSDYLTPGTLSLSTTGSIPRLISALPFIMENTPTNLVHGIEL
jgi:glutamate racemase